MHLKYIELFGFKTFPDKIRIPFDPAINIIVGPNGCGKTNIVDAVRFILGEQNLKDLRLKSMNDIIFHGSNIRSRSSVALCRGVFENDAKLNFKYKDFSEIMLERRHYKNKDTEYRINGIQVGYREYIDFFNESSLSRHYSIIDSSKINSILNYKPDELRLFFEEAAGITKYKIQKKSASKKLEASQFNLLRINDLFNEVEKQLIFLEKASKTLEEYKKLENDRKLSNYFLYERSKSKITGEIERYDKEFENYSTQLSSADAKDSLFLKLLTDLKTSFDGKESEYRLALNEKNESAIELAKLNSRIEYAGVTVKNLEAEINKKTREMEEQGESKIRNAEKSATLEESLSAAELKLKELRERLNASDKIVSEKKASVMKIKDEIETVSDEILAIVEESQNNNNKLNFNVRNIKTIEARINDSRSLAVKISGEIDDAAAVLTEKAEQSSAAQIAMENLKAEHSMVSAEFSRLSGSADECISRKDAAYKELIGIDMNISRLADFIDGREGFSAGTRKFMSSNRDYPAYVLSDLVEIEPGFEKAAWECAGEMLETVIVDNLDDMRKTLDYIGVGNSGELKVFVPGRRKNPVPSVAGALSLIGEKLSVVPLSNKIKLNFRGMGIEDAGINLYYSEKAGAVLDYIEQTGFFPEIDIITGDGVIFFSGGLISGGKNKNIESANLFLNKNKLAEYTNLKTQKQDELNKEESLLRAEKSEMDVLNSQINRLVKDISAKEMEKITVDNDIKHIEGQMVKSRERLEILNAEYNNLESEKSAIYEEERKLKEEISTLEEELKLKTGEKLALENKMRDFTQEFEDAKEGETALKIEINSSEQSINFLRKQVQDMASNISGYEKRINMLNEQREKTKDELARAMDGLSLGRERLSLLNGNILTADVKIKDMEVLLEDLKNRIVAGEKEIEEAGRQKSAIERKKDSARTYADMYREKLEELDSSSNFIGMAPNFSEEDKVFIAGMEKIRDDKIKSRIEEISGKIAVLGDVNMNAAKEYGEALERLGFLEKQKKDLENSIELLQGVIKKLDAVSKEKFNSSLSMIRQKFGELFVNLFGGGHADILSLKGRAEDPDGGEPDIDDKNLTAAGMEISVQIPGKKISGINILSQGERVLVAVSLLFAIFLVKKTPFCVIDEVDAPLDYANNARYNKLIGEVSNYSQIILVTHNKKTMEIGKNIFGVTSKHAGISGIVSVSMN